MEFFSKYFIVAILSVVIVLQLLRILKTLFNPIFLANRIFDFPDGKLMKVLYYLCTIAVAMLVILLKLEIID